VDDVPCFYIDIPGLAFGYTYGTGIEAESFGKIKAFFDEQKETTVIIFNKHRYMI
jgi:hypothetical protein